MDRHASTRGRGWRRLCEAARDLEAQAAARPSRQLVIWRARKDNEDHVEDSLVIERGDEARQDRRRFGAPNDHALDSPARRATAPVVLRAVPRGSHE